MAYRSIKRVLGETSLERKCRLLFGLALLLLVTVSFWRVGLIAERLILETTRSKGHDLVDVIVIKAHALHWATREGWSDEATKELLQEIIDETEKDQDYDHRIVTLNDDYKIQNLEAIGPEDEEEAAILRQLQDLVQRRGTPLDGPLALDGTPVPPPGAMPGEPRASAPRTDPIRLDRRAPDGAYHYYEPVAWHRSCNVCHMDLHTSGVFSAADGNTVYEADRPLFAVKVIIPYEATQQAITRSRAILISVAILTVFMAMVALYVIVRYVVVKPLKHLRDVSDKVSRGELEVRAEIQTGDEFQELGESFNRMLRHLTEAQAELREVNADLDNKVDQLAQLNMRLYEMNRVKGDFLANMSHELRTPLNSIIGFSEVLAGIDSLTDKQKRYAQNIQKSGRVLLEMINDILDLAKMESGKMEVRPSEFPLEAVVQAQCDIVRTLAEEKQIDLDVIVDTEVPPVYQDQAKFQQILTNLLSNAIKFTPEGGRITVTGRRVDDDRLELTVEDTGVGIAEEDREIIFEKFRQSSSVLGDDGLTREYSGTGLGLSIIKELCKLLDGEIQFESELGKGSTFRVILPWVRSGRAPLESQIASRLNELTRQNLVPTAPSTSDG